MIEQPLPGGVTKQQLEEAVHKCILGTDRKALFGHPRLAERTHHLLLNQRVDGETIIDHKVAELMRQVFDSVFRILVIGNRHRRRAIALDAQKYGASAHEILNSVQCVRDSRSFSTPLMDLEDSLYKILKPAPFGEKIYDWLRCEFNAMLARQLQMPTLAQEIILYPAIESDISGAPSAGIIRRADETEQSFRERLFAVPGYDLETQTAVFNPIQQEVTAVRKWFSHSITSPAPREDHS